MVFPIKVGISFITEEYEEYMKKHEMTYNTEVTTVQADVSPVVVSEYDEDQKYIQRMAQMQSFVRTQVFGFIKKTIH